MTLFSLIRSVNFAFYAISQSRTYLLRTVGCQGFSETSPNDIIQDTQKIVYGYLGNRLDYFIKTYIVINF